jgi:hypothetical protein
MHRVLKLCTKGDERLSCPENPTNQTNMKDYCFLAVSTTTDIQMFLHLKFQSQTSCLTDFGLGGTSQERGDHRRAFHTKTRVGTKLPYEKGSSSHGPRDYTNVIFDCLILLFGRALHEIPTSVNFNCPDLATIVRNSMFHDLKNHEDDPR